jgi:hypothetical protein
VAVELVELRPHAGKRGQRGKQRIEQRGAHAHFLHRHGRGAEGAGG